MSSTTRTRKKRKRKAPTAATRKSPKAAKSSRRSRPTAVATRSSEPAERTDDPVRMYLREMGSVELLSREGEIAIAKRIEAGREAMIAGLCESPLTFQAIIIWRDELNDGKILLRDIIDLEASYSGPDGKKAPKPDYSAPGAPPPPNPARDRLAPATAPQAPPEGFEGEVTPPPESFDDEDDLENSVSLSAMEADLKPRVLETFDRIADAYKKLRRLQDQNVENKLRSESLSPAQERKYKALEEGDRGRRQVALAQPEPHRRAGRATLRHQQAPDRSRHPPHAHGRGPSRRPRGLSQKLPEFRARPEMALARLEAGDARVARVHRHRQEPDQGNPRRNPVAGHRDWA